MVASIVCPFCGGSGKLEHDEGGYVTCAACSGIGRMFEDGMPSEEEIRWANNPEKYFEEVFIRSVKLSESRGVDYW